MQGATAIAFLPKLPYLAFLAFSQLIQTINFEMTTEYFFLGFICLFQV